MKFGTYFEEKKSDFPAEWQSYFISYSELRATLEENVQEYSVDLLKSFPKGHNFLWKHVNSAVNLHLNTVDPRLLGETEKHGEVQSEGISQIDQQQVESFSSSSKDFKRILGARLGVLSEQVPKFIELLDKHVEKMDMFIRKNVEEGAQRVEEILEQIKENKTKEGHSGIKVNSKVFKDLSESLDKIVLLEQFIFLNITVLVKLLKRLDKHSGLKIKEPYIMRVGQLLVPTNTEILEIKEKTMNKIAEATGNGSESENGNSNGERAQEEMDTILREINLLERIKSNNEGLINIASGKDGENEVKGLVEQKSEELKIERIMNKVEGMQNITVSLRGPHGTDIIGGLLDCCSRYKCKILDFSLSRLHHNVVFGVLIHIRGTQVELFNALVRAARQWDAVLTFDVQNAKLQAKQIADGLEYRLEEAPYAGRVKYVATLLKENGLGSTFLDTFVKWLLAKRISVLKMKRLDSSKVLKSIEFTLSVPGDLDIEALRLDLFQLSSEHFTDVAFQPDNVFRRQKRLVVFDMDSTLIQQEVIDEIARHAGIVEKVSEITELAMRGMIDFKESLARRVKLLEGTPVEVLELVRKQLQFTEGAHFLCRALKSAGFKLAVISGGFVQLAKYVKAELGLDYHFANQLETTSDGKYLTGRTVGPVVDAEHGLEATISEYISGFVLDAIKDIETTWTSGNAGAGDEEDSVQEVVRTMLEESGEQGKKIEAICTEIEKMLLEEKQRIQEKRVGSRRGVEFSAGGITKLDKPISLTLDQAKISRETKMVYGEVDIGHTKGRKVASQVDTKKLKKAEAKIASKLEKRELKANYEASKLIDGKTAEEEEEEFLRMVNPILDYTESKGRNKDIILENFDISFGGKRILTDSRLQMNFGRRYGLIGRNGIGKSTLLRHISRRELTIPTFISILHVEQEMAGDDTPAIESVVKADYFRTRLLKEEKELNAEVQEIESELSQSQEDKERCLELEKQKSDAGNKLNEVHRKLQEIEADKAEAKAGEILSGLGFAASEFLNPTRSFSGGWRMRLSLARALFCKPDLLLLDEPTNMLDFPAVVWLERYLRTWPNTLLVVSHDRDFLDEVATDIIHQHSERLDQYRGNFSSFWSTADERKKNQQREYEAQQKLRAHLQDYIDRWRYNAKRASQAQSKLKVLEKLPELEPPELEKVVTFTFPETERITPPLLYMDEVTFKYPTASNFVLKNVNIDMRMDSRVAIVGPNGAGKTTLLKLLIGDLDPSSGHVHKHGRLKIAYFSQHHVDQLDTSLTAIGHMMKTFPGRTEEEYRRNLGSFGISGLTGLQKISTLSGGQKSRVTFACLAVLNPHFLVLDEPTNHLDMESIDALTAALRKFNGGVVIVSHDQRFISSVCDEIWVCNNACVTLFRGNGIKEYKDSICSPTA
ncbi:putative ABC transporter ATP-binding protein [Zancudomyces culisetae]|uniref:O-phosphoserine phosphohydrolase n=1 Tax=Zancudomyces culisetae TaxID=1213189 RepID=A0A1R1PKY1_ZANCU|nr:putative ABC transporter ATP-binding protein [Zancudomyces culisetae]|eukprot:OMH81583.1 putative ABC transporter ATP-binding protein [Zancudomyces culisetae]